MEKISIKRTGQCPCRKIIARRSGLDVRCMHPASVACFAMNDAPPPKDCPLRDGPLTIELAEGV